MGQQRRRQIQEQIFSEKQQQRRQLRRLRIEERFSFARLLGSDAGAFGIAIAMLVHEVSRKCENVFFGWLCGYGVGLWYQEHFPRYRLGEIYTIWPSLGLLGSWFSWPSII